MTTEAPSLTTGALPAPESKPSDPSVPLVATEQLARCPVRACACRWRYGADRLCHDHDQDVFQEHNLIELKVAMKGPHR